MAGACIGVVVATAWACGGSSEGPDPAPLPDDGIVDPPDNRPAPETDSGTGGGEDAGTDAGPVGGEDAGTDAGTDGGTGGGTDGGTTGGTDGGTGGGTDGGTTGGTDGGTQPNAGPWPQDPVVNYSAKYNIRRVKSVGVDAAHNIWLLDGSSIGVLRSDTKQLVWNSTPVGQARLGFGSDKLATGSRVICGGKGGEAYVGYETVNDIPQGQRIPARGEEGFSLEHYEHFQKGDMDVVRLNASKTDVELNVHLYQSAGSSRPSGNEPLGIRNTNDFHFDEDRSVYSCLRVMRGPYAGEIYIGTNHGVTRIRGYTYNSHRHPAWWENGSQRAGYTFGLGISQEGHLLIANDWKIGIIPPNAALEWWDAEGRKPNMPADVEPAVYALNTFVDPVNPGDDVNRSTRAPENFWRCFQQTTDGLFYLGSLTEGLWQLKLRKDPHATPLKYYEDGYTYIDGLGTKRIHALAATDDGSLFIGTGGKGLWRMKPDKTLEKVASVNGGEVTQLVYDPTVSPTALYVLADGYVYVLRGH
nr:hypothetical protein [Pyxidicoccus fallax]